MASKSSLIVCQSVHHGNTLKVAQAMANTLGAEVQSPLEVKPEKIIAYDLIGFGSGIYDGKHYETLFELTNSLNPQRSIKVFVFSTAAFPVKSMHNRLKLRLMDKGFDIIGEFQCKGFMTHGFTKLFGGINKGRPNQKDLEKAREFVGRLTY